MASDRQASRQGHTLYHDKHKRPGQRDSVTTEQQEKVET